MVFDPGALLSNWNNKTLKRLDVPKLAQTTSQLRVIDRCQSVDMNTRDPEETSVTLFALR